MHTRILAAILLALALPALAAGKKKKPEPTPLPDIPLAPLPPLVPLTPAPPASEPAPAAAARPAQPAEVPPPPLLKLTTQIGVVLLDRGALDAVAAARVVQGLRGVAEAAPLSQGPLVLDAPRQPCDDEACLAVLGEQNQLDQVLAARVTGRTLRVRVIDVASRKQSGQGEAPVERDAELATAAAEALACKLLLPSACQGDALVDADLPAVQLAVDGQKLPRNARTKLPVGPHTLRATLGTLTAARALPVLREPLAGASLYVRQLPSSELRLSSPAELPRAADGALRVAASEAPRVRNSSWTRPAGIAAAGAGALLLAVGGIEGARSHSLLGDANRSFSANGGVYRQQDLPSLRSGNSAARTANVLFVAGGVVAAAGLLLAFAF